MSTTAKLKKLPKVFKAKWLKALRSGKYKQTREFLRSDTGFCCIGVACDIHKKNAWDKETGKTESGRKYYHTRIGGNEEFPSCDDLPYAVMNVLRQRHGPDDVMSHLASMNDGKKRFTTIANWIETHL